MKSMFAKIPKILFMGIPLVLGLCGLVLIDNEPFLHSLFMSVSMYFLNYQDMPQNILVEIARWTAPIVTASGILLAITVLREKLHNIIMYKKGESVAVYGPDNIKERLLSEIGSCGIDGKVDFVNAQKYILAGNEEENFQFYYRHMESLKHRTVYLKCSSLRAQSVSDLKLHLFCPEETSARLFWKQHCLYEKSKTNNHHLDIVFLGFGKLGEELLNYGLQNNIFSSNQKITYHIFGDGSAFSATHTELQSISDLITFYNEPWYKQLSLLEQAQMIIVLTQEEQIQLLRSLLFAIPERVIDVFASNHSGAELLEEHERLRLFDWNNEAQKLDNIFSDLLFKRAKAINLRYAHIYGGVPETAEVSEEEWSKLDSFTRYSNISAADYHEVRLKMLEIMGESNSYEQINAENQELLAELEHERWCRYHYLNNWKHGIPENNKNKDKIKKIHKDLIPYNLLTNEEKEKDRENIRILLSI